MKRKPTYFIREKGLFIRDVTPILRRNFGHLLITYNWYRGPNYEQNRGSWYEIP